MNSNVAGQQLNISIIEERQIREDVQDDIESNGPQVQLRDTERQDLNSEVDQILNIIPNDVEDSQDSQL